MPMYIAKFPFYYQTSHYCGKFLHKKFSHTTAVPIIPLQEDLIKYPHKKSGYKADLIRSYKQLINEMSWTAEKLCPSHNVTKWWYMHLNAWNSNSHKSYTYKRKLIYWRALFTNSCKFKKAIISLKCVCNKV